MASNMTPFYGLSQWAGTDNFSRADFNRDNSKIDTALGDLKYKLLAQPWALAAYYQPGTDALSLSLNLEGVELSKYLYLMLYIDIKAGTEGGYCLRLNGNSSSTYYKAGSTSPQTCLMKNEFKSGYPKSCIIRFSPYEESTNVCCSFEGYCGSEAGAGSAAAEGITWDALKSIDCVATETAKKLKAGSGMYLYGMKKA